MAEIQHLTLPQKPDFMEGSLPLSLARLVYSNQCCPLSFYLPGFELCAKALHSTKGPIMPLIFSKAVH